MEDFNLNLLPDLTLAGVTDQDLAAWQYDSWKQDNLTNLLQTSSYEGRTWEAIERDIDNNNMGEDEYYALLFNLQNAQTEPISAGRNYSMRDIKNHLKLLL